MLFQDGSLCIVCGHGILHRVVDSIDFKYKGFSLHLDGYISYACPHCKEELVNKYENSELMSKILLFKHEVDYPKI